MDFSTLQFSDFVRLAPIIFEKGKQLLPLEARNSGLFRVTPIPLNTGSTREFSDSVDTGQYARRKGEGEQAVHARIKQGYKKIMHYGRVGLDLTITHEAMTLNKYPEIVRELTNLGMHVANRIELDLQHRITFGTSTSYVNMDGETVDLTLGDGLQLFYSAHTLTGSSVTYRNAFADGKQGWIPGGATQLPSGNWSAPGSDRVWQLSDSPFLFVGIGWQQGPGSRNGGNKSSPPNSTASAPQKPKCPDDWDTSIKNMNEVAKMIGGYAKPVYYGPGDEPTEIHGVTMSFSNVVSKFKYHWDPHKDHWGGTDLKILHNNSWYHLTVYYPYKNAPPVWKKWGRDDYVQVDAKSRDDSLPAPRITIHCDPHEPGTFEHLRKDFLNLPF